MANLLNAFLFVQVYTRLDCASALWGCRSCFTCSQNFTEYKVPILKTPALPIPVMNPMILGGLFPPKRFCDSQPLKTLIWDSGLYFFHLWGISSLTSVGQIQSFVWNFCFQQGHSRWQGPPQLPPAGLGAREGVWKVRVGCKNPPRIVKLRQCSALNLQQFCRAALCRNLAWLSISLLLSP